MCAIGGCSSSHAEFDAAAVMNEAMFYQQHRGDAATGISTMTYDDRFDGNSAEGFVLTAHSPEILARIAGRTAVAHNLWSTDTENPVMQPIWSSDPKFAFVHNGQLSETTELRAYVESFGIDSTYFNDSRLAASAIELTLLAGKKKTLDRAIEKVYPMLNGGFACVAMHGHEIAAFRDPGGLRRLELAEVEGGHMVASETVAFRPGVAKYIGEVAGGEMILMQGSDMERVELAPYRPKQDPFEVIYLADRNSQMFGMSVDHMRRRMGAQLAKQFPFTDKEYLVMGVPETGIPIAETYARKLGLEYKSGLNRNRFRPGRSFMQRTAEQQRNTVTGKVTVVPGSVRGRDVIVVEDSFVRFTTAPEINDMLEEEGALSVTMLAASPPQGYPDHSGVNTRRQKDLPAFSKTPEKLRRMVGCDRLGYLALSRLLKALDQPAKRLNLSVFKGKYPYNIGHHADNIRPSVSLDYLEGAYAEA
ncbi:MAG: amidophosphoribosyltransferase [Candidatus Saccharimonadales bacterium]